MTRLITALSLVSFTLSHHTGHHGFEGRDDHAATRLVIEQTLDFVKRTTDPAFQSVIRAVEPRR